MGQGKPCYPAPTLYHTKSNMSIGKEEKMITISANFKKYEAVVMKINEQEDEDRYMFITDICAQSFELAVGIVRITMGKHMYKEEDYKIIRVSEEI